MIPAIAVAVVVFVAVALKLASTERFVDNLKKSPVLTVILGVDVVFVLLSLILHAMSLMLLPSVSYIAAAVLVPVTVFAAMIKSIRKVIMYIIAGLLCVVLVLGVIVMLPEHYITKDFDGVEYVGVADSYDDMKYVHNYIYYYESKFPLVIASEYDYSEYYGVRLDDFDWDEIIKEGPTELNYYEDGELVRTKPIYEWTK